jgi:hypothetical protein
LPEIKTIIHFGTESVLQAATNRYSKLASVLRKLDCGSLLKYLRHFLHSPKASLPRRMKPYRRSSIITLGRAIVVIYLIILLTAVISARTQSESELDQPGQRGVEPQKTAPNVARG